MAEKFKEMTTGINVQLAKLRKEMPDVMNGFSALSQAATKDGVLDKKSKELIAIALAAAIAYFLVWRKRTQ